MGRERTRHRLLCLTLATAVALSAGCAIGTRVHTTAITVQTSSNELLHVAAIPRVLPSGERPTEQLADLLAEVARKAGGYTLVENVEGGWIPPDRSKVLTELNDLLLVKGPPEVAHLLRARLREDFQQEYPFVVSLPIQSIAVIRGAPPPAGTEPPAEQEAAEAEASGG